VQKIIQIAVARRGSKALEYSRADPRLRRQTLHGGLRAGVQVIQNKSRQL